MDGVAGRASSFPFSHLDSGRTPAQAHLARGIKARSISMHNLGRDVRIRSNCTLNAAQLDLHDHINSVHERHCVRNDPDRLIGDVVALKQHLILMHEQNCAFGRLGNSSTWLDVGSTSSGGPAGQKLHVWLQKRKHTQNV